MILNKYKEDRDQYYSWYWTHSFKSLNDGREVVVSPIFESEEDAMTWGKNLKEEMLKAKVIV